MAQVGQAAQFQDQLKLQAPLQDQLKLQADQAAYRKQLTTHQALMEQRSRSTQQEQLVRRQLEDARKQITLEASRQAKLHELLAQTRNYTAQCKGWIAALVTSDDAAPSRTAGSQNQLLSVQPRLSRSLVADSGALVAKVGHAEGMEARLVERLREDTKELESLGPHFAAAEKEMGKELLKEKEKGERANLALEHNIRDIDEAHVKRDALLKEAEELKQQLSPVALATIQAENDAYRAELVQALQRLRQQEVREARAAAAASQAEAEADVQKEAAATAAKDVQTAAAEGRKQLASAVAQERAHDASSEGTLQEAEEVVKAKCRDRHTARQERMRREVGRCTALEQQLTVTKARAEAMGQALRAQQAALFVSS